MWCNFKEIHICGTAHENKFTCIPFILGSNASLSTHTRLYINVFLERTKDQPKAPQKEKNDANESSAPSKDEVQEWLAKVTQEHPVLLFMKGTPEAPQCGFSRRVVLILRDLDASFASANVLVSPEVREGIKVFSNWMTFPQLYIKGKLVGGCDIVTDLNETGELKKMLEEAGVIKPKSAGSA